MNVLISLSKTRRAIIQHVKPARKSQAGEESERVAEAMKFQQALLKAQSEASPDGILVVSDKRKWLSYNQRFIEMWGLPDSIVEERSSAAALAYVRDKVAEPKTFIATTNYLYDHPDETSHDEVALKDGRVFDRYSALVKSPEGKHYGRVWFYRDISERVASQTALQQARDQLTEAIEAISDGFALYDAEDRLVLFNSKYRDIYSASAEAIVPGNSFEEILRYGLEQGQYEAAIGQPDAWLRERLARHRTPSGTPIEQELSGGRWLRIDERRTKDGGIVGIRTDITELKTREARMRLLYEITSQNSRDIGEQINEALELTTKMLKLEIGILSRVNVEEKSYTIEACYAPETDLQPGQRFALGQTYCDITLQADAVVAIDHMEASAQHRHPCYEVFALEAYIGIPIVVDEALYGTLNFSSRRPQTPPFEEVDKETLRLLGQWLVAMTKQKRAEAELNAYHHHLEDLVSARTAQLAQSNQRLEQEISERKTLEKQLERQAYYDALTGLANRRLFEQRYERELQHLSENGRLTLLYMDLNRFKQVNDSLGHSAGDELLKGVAERLKASLRSRELLARFGGDEFAVLLQDTGDAEAAYAAERVKDVLTPPFILETHPVQVGISIGVASTNTKQEGFAELLRRADLAMYKAKAQGGGIHYYKPEVDQHFQARMQLERTLRASLVNGDLALHYQPILNLEAESSVMSESLLRWHHPEQGLLLPDKFIPVAEESDLIVQLDRWVIREAVRQAKTGGFSVTVNVSSRSLQTPEFCDYVSECLEDAELPPEQLCIEITERVMTHVERSLPTLQKLAVSGIRLMVDDFGTGYSSLAYLQHYPLYALKLDRSFLHTIDTNPKAKAVAKTIIQLAHDLGLVAVAEGVETASQRDWAKDVACDLAQGYLFARPMPLIQLLA